MSSDAGCSVLVSLASKGISEKCMSLEYQIAICGFYLNLLRTHRAKKLGTFCRVSAYVPRVVTAFYFVQQLDIVVRQYVLVREGLARPDKDAG